VNAHPRGARPFTREEYVRKFTTLAAQYVTTNERARFLATALALCDVGPGQLERLNVVVPPAVLDVDGIVAGLFERGGA